MHISNFNSHKRYSTDEKRVVYYISLYKAWDTETEPCFIARYGIRSGEMFVQHMFINVKQHEQSAARFRRFASGNAPWGRPGFSWWWLPEERRICVKKKPQNMPDELACVHRGLFINNTQQKQPKTTALTQNIAP